MPIGSGGSRKALWGSEAAGRHTAIAAVAYKGSVSPSYVVMVVFVLLASVSERAAVWKPSPVWLYL